MTDEDAPEVRVCETCNDTGSICDTCRHADGDCVCPHGPDLVDCPDCAEE